MMHFIGADEHVTAVWSTDQQKRQKFNGCSSIAGAGRRFTRNHPQNFDPKTAKHVKTRLAQNFPSTKKPPHLVACGGGALFSAKLFRCHPVMLISKTNRDSTVDVDVGIHSAAVSHTMFGPDGVTVDACSSSAVHCGSWPRRY
jgi:hypothetical protein